MVRRAQIPIRMTSGFNPHPRISLPQALGLGIEGQAEIVEMELSEWMPPNEVVQTLGRFAPEGIQMLSVKVIPPHAKAQVTDITYEIAAPEGDAFWKERIRRVMDAQEILVERCKEGKAKQVNLRAFLLDISLKDDKIQVWLKVKPEGTARVEEVLDALLGRQAEPIPRRIARSHVNLIEDEELRRRRMRP